VKQWVIDLVLLRVVLVIQWVTNLDRKMDEWLVLLL